MPQPNLKSAIAKCMAERRLALLQKIDVEALRIRDDLIENGPVDTGIARGSLSGAPIQANHKGRGLPVGNKPGDSGWQVRPGPHTLTEDSVSIGTPLWEAYLKWVETGWIHARSKKQIPSQRFVFWAWQMHLHRAGTAYAR